MFTVVRTTTNLSLDEHFIKHPAVTFFVKVEGDGMVDHGIYKGDNRAARQGRNPATGETIQIAASKQPKLKAGKGLKEAVNSRKN